MNPSCDYDALIAQYGPELLDLSVRQIAQRLDITRHAAHQMQQRLRALHGPPLDAIRRDYSRWGGGRSAADIAADYGLSLDQVQDLRKAMGWTHRMGPLSDDEITDGEPDALVQRMLDIKRASVEIRAQDAEHAAAIRDADRWRNWQRSTLDRLADAIGDMPRAVHAPRVELDTALEPYTAIWFPTDFHYGGYGWLGYGGEAYDTMTASTLLKVATSRTIGRLPGQPDRIVVPIGGDFFHIDNVQGTTTKGTPQDMDGVPEQIVVDGMRLLLRMLALLRTVAPLDIVLAAGNHDKILSLCAFELVRVYFRDDPEVVIHGDAGPYQIIQYGNTAIGVTHGDNRHTVSDLSTLMATKWPKLWGDTDHRLWLVGHRHHVRAEEGPGVMLLQCPSLAGSDRYHTNAGYAHQSRQAMQTHLVGRNCGYMGCIYVGF